LTKYEREDFPCECSHAHRDHDNDPNTVGCTVKGPEGLFCYCLNFSPDNLRFLEQHADE